MEKRMRRELRFFCHKFKHTYLYLNVGRRTMKKEDQISYPTNKRIMRCLLRKGRELVRKIFRKKRNYNELNPDHKPKI